MVNFLIKWHKKRHFKSKIIITQKKLWDLEWLKAQLLGEREVYRQEYDQKSETAAALQERLKNFEALENPDKDEIEKAKQALQVTLDRRGNLTKFMEAIDQQIKGVDEPNERGQAIHKEGLDETITGHYNMVNLLKEYRDKI